MAADPVIAEFQAVNISTLKDSDGEASDWIEIENPDTASVNLLGWHLTDDPGDLEKWTFPDVTLPAGGRLVVYASNKDLRDPLRELHTNFRLSADGEYLALVKPDGVTVTKSYDPYPIQFEDQSYGQSLLRNSDTLVSAGSAATALVPTDDSLGVSWTQVGFNDASWQAGKLNVGFENCIRR